MASRRDPSILQKYPDNPFNPGFGTTPPLLAGREEIVNERLLGLNRGAGRHELHHVVVGARGTGKTVLLREIGRAAEEHHRALVLYWSGTESFEQRVADQVPALEAALRGFTRRGAKALRPELTVKAAPGGIGAEARFGVRDRPGTDSSAHQRLESAARLAATRHCLILLLADELQSTSLDDLRRLGVAAQHLSMDLSLPFAVLGAGLPHTARMLRTSGVTFLERQLVTTIGALDAESTREAIEVPILDAGRKIEPEALDRLAFASGGYPFAVQVVGHHAWQAAGDDDTITRVHASAAARHARRHLEQTMFEGAWARITRADRGVLYLAATLADSTGTLTVASLADAVGRPMRSLSASRDRLINEHQVVHPAQRGSLQFSVPGFREWVVARGRELLDAAATGDTASALYRAVEQAVNADPTNPTGP